MTRPGWTTFPILPIHPDGSCSCRDPKCKDAGKHPAIKWGRKSLPAGTQTTIPSGYGIGLATGARSGVVVLDIDMKDGKDGCTALEALAAGRPIPATLAAYTPTGGVHFYFQHPGCDIHNSAGVLGEGIDVRGDGGYVVIPPSPHKAGGQYAWVDDPDAPLAPLPEWLLTTIKSPPRKPRKVGREELSELAQKWSRARSPMRKKLGDALSKVVKGESFAPEGERDTTLFQLTQDIAKAFPDADVDAMAALFSPSLDMMPGGPSEEDVADKFGRAVDAVPEWHTELVVSDTGAVKPCLGNAVVVLRNSPAWREVCAYDERELQPVFTRQPPTGEIGPVPHRIVDTDATNTATWFTTAMRIPISGTVAFEALMALARERPFDRFREHLEGLQWDGRPRLDRWLTTYAGVEDTAYTRAVGTAWVISIAARTLDPGCKVDTMLILEGEQGKLKSTLLESLVGVDFFCDRLPDIANKDALLQLQGPAVIEVAELASFTRKEAEHVKSFLSQRHDRFRVPYGRSTEIFPRRCVFAGTTNAEHYFTDQTGNRRFWPVRVGKCDPDKLKVDRDQLMAEAVHRYRAGEHWWLGDDLEAMAAAEQEARVSEDAWIDVLRPKLQGVTETTIAHALQQLMIPEGQWSHTAHVRAGQALRSLGFQVQRKRTDLGRSRVYVRSSAMAGTKPNLTVIR